MRKQIILVWSMVMLLMLAASIAPSGQKAAKRVPVIGWEALRSKLTCPSAAGRSDLDRVYVVSMTFGKNGSVGSVEVQRVDGPLGNAPADYCDSAIVAHTKEIVTAEQWKSVSSEAPVREMEFVLRVAHGEFGIGFQNGGTMEFMSPAGKDTARTTLIR